MDNLKAEQFLGLTDFEVAERVSQGKINKIKEVTSRRFGDIVRENVFTRFNAIIALLIVVTLAIGSARDALFGLVLVVNILIGIIQELRAKWMLDHLYLVTAPKSRAVRNGKEVEILSEEVVLDDVLKVSRGDQIIADGTIIQSEGLEIDESLLTGESAPVAKEKDSQVFSGSFVVAGEGKFKTTKVGSDSYARKLILEARHFGLANSELRNSINKILRFLTWVIIPVGLLLLINQFRPTNSLPDKILGIVAGIDGMIPQGLVLLTSVAFAVAVVRLGRRNVLVQELPAVEVLARVDTLCIDKTGTLTESALALNRVINISSEKQVAEALGAIGSISSLNSDTLAAIAEKYHKNGHWQAGETVPFSSKRKWSAVSFQGKGSWIIGAPEILLEKVGDNQKLNDQINSLAEAGFRLLFLAQTGEKIEKENLPQHLEPAAIIVLEEKIREDAPAILKYFYDQGVKIKVVSGDNPNTAAVAAKRAGVADVGTPIDARKLASDPNELAEAMEKHTVFGRVTPEQKRSMVAALQANGHVVAMTGDGVNDVLALKKADLGITIGPGSSATKAVAQLVLIDCKFANLPWVVAEGRRVIANIERVANLFLTKTVYIILLALAVSLLGWPFPLLPRDLTIIDTITIGIPAFFLSLAPNRLLYKKGFISRVLNFAVPVGMLVAAATFFSYLLLQLNHSMNLDQSRTMITLLIGITGLWILNILARPLTELKKLLIFAMIILLGASMVLPSARQFFEFDFPHWLVILETLAIAVFSIFVLESGWRIMKKVSS